MTIIQPRQQNIGVLPDLDDGSWDELPEISDEFEPGLFIVMEQYDISMDPTMGNDQAMRNRDLGVLGASFGIVDDSRKQWSILVNWQTVWADRIPPHHMGVAYDGQPVGIISSFLTMRACWKCALGQPIVNGEYSDDGYYRPGGKIPWVLPAHPCPRCKEYDWWGTGTSIIGGIQARREDFQRSAAEHLERMTGKEGVADSMSMVHGTDGNKIIRA